LLRGCLHRCSSHDSQAHRPRYQTIVRVTHVPPSPTPID
jgi:hypothetical protein